LNYITNQKSEKYYENIIMKKLENNFGHCTRKKRLEYSDKLFKRRGN